jgi:hypothetical protein
MVKAGGVAQAAMLPVIAISALFFRHKLLPQEVRPPAWQTAGLWLAAVTTIALMTYYVLLQLR